MSSQKIGASVCRDFAPTIFISMKNASRSESLAKVTVASVPLAFLANEMPACTVATGNWFSAVKSAKDWFGVTNHWVLLSSSTSGLVESQ